MASYKLSRRAGEALRGITVSSLNQWREKQARIYVNTIHQTMLKRANTPQIGKVRKELFDNARCFRTNQHIIDYRKSSEDIEVARMLHQRLDKRATFK